MDIILSSNGNRYITKRDRQTYLGIVWLGEVTHGGQSGAFAYNKTTDKHLMYLQGGRAVVLDDIAVGEAMSRAQQPRKAGRPTIGAEKLHPRMATMSDTHYGIALTLGNGNFSAGVRLALDACGLGMS